LEKDKTLEIPDNEIESGKKKSVAAAPTSGDEYESEYIIQPFLTTSRVQKRSKRYYPR
jgi:hypothetical protein